MIFLLSMATNLINPTKVQDAKCSQSQRLCNASVLSVIFKNRDSQRIPIFVFVLINTPSNGVGGGDGVSEVMELLDDLNACGLLG